MAKRHGGNGARGLRSAALGDAADAHGGAPLTEQNVFEFLCKSVRDESHWRPSKSLAKCLAVPYQRLLVTTRKDDLANLVWNTVLVLSTFATRFVDYHEQWYEVGEAASLWLYRQMHFVEHREDLVRSACALLQIRDPALILTTLFAEPKDEATLALETALGADWKLCYLQEPPYSLYYWNEKTNHSTWRNPLETAKLLKEMEEQKARKAELLAKYLPQRLKINRDLLEVVKHSCGECRRDAQVLCIDCGSKYFCESCCDERHCETSELAHIDTGFRFIDCFGRNGFPNNRNTLQRRQQPHEEIAQSSNME